MRKANKIEDLNKDELIELVNLYAKNWMSHDESWFMSSEELLGMETTLEIDRNVWDKFSVIEARGIMDYLGLPENSGIEGLRKALAFRMFSTVNEQLIEVEDENTLKYYVTNCRIQTVRRRNDLPDLPCISVGKIEYTRFAKTIDSRFEVRCVSCPPDVTSPDFYCVWKFILNKEDAK